MKLFIIFKCTGEYDDYEEKIVKVLESKEQAENVVNELFEVENSERLKGNLRNRHILLDSFKYVELDIDDTGNAIILSEFEKWK